MSNVLDKIFAVARALEKGESLRNVETWKSRQALMIPFSVIFALLPQFLPIELHEGEINSISYGLAILFSSIATYLVPATTTKIGVSKKEKK